MQNVIAAAEANKSRLIFLDNIYMYGPPPLQDPITENHPLEPSSKKGAIRKALAANLLDAHKQGRILALIARAPDFYGPHAKNSSLYATVITRIKEKKGPMWLGDPDLTHSLGHVGDIARSMLLLAQDENAYGQVWHTPTRPEPVSARQLHQMIDQALGTSTRLKVLPKAMINVLKYFVPVLKEVQEMAYQYYQPYNFSSRKFMQAFPTLEVTPYEKGVEEMVATV
jgi:nucleoside-diphosphate-sugar epimerase